MIWGRNLALEEEPTKYDKERKPRKKGDKIQKKMPQPGPNTGAHQAAG